MPSPWSDLEVRLAVQDYFDMLLLELKGEKYVKSDHNKRLSSKLQSRNKPSIEFKHQNISAVLLEMDLPYIDGYKPRSNYQGLLRDVVIEQVEKHRAELGKLAVTPPDADRPVKHIDLAHVLVEPPEYMPKSIKETVQVKNPRLFDFPGQEALNRKLGMRGEEFVVQFETMRLEQAGNRDLAKRIEWVSRKDDTAGFDILSFGDGNKERFIEVKTTNYAKSFPFLISSGEVQFSETQAEAYYLYRVFTFKDDPRLFMLPGDIRRHCQLEPKVFRARVG